MAAYEALFNGAASTDLSAYTSDSGHVHTLRDGTGALLLDGGGLLYGAADSLSAVYTADYTPPSADYELEFQVRTGSALADHTIGMGIRCETDGDGIFAFYNGFSDVGLQLSRIIGGSETSLDTFALATSTTYTVTLIVSGNDISWEVDGAPQGTFSVSTLTAAGLVGFTKFSGESTDNIRAKILSALVTESGGDPPIDVTNVGGIARPTMQVVCREIWTP
jgi:hypothetical protein